MKKLELTQEYANNDCLLLKTTLEHCIYDKNNRTFIIIYMGTTITIDAYDISFDGYNYRLGKSIAEKIYNFLYCQPIKMSE